MPRRSTKPPKPPKPLMRTSPSRLRCPLGAPMRRPVPTRSRDAARGSSAVRTPSPRTVSARTVTKRAAGGQQQVLRGRLVPDVGGGEHLSPGRRRRLHADPEEGQRGLDGDVLRHEQRRVGDDGGGEPGQQFPAGDPPGAPAAEPGRRDVIEPLEGERLGAHHLGDVAPGEQPDDQGDQDGPGEARRDDREQRQRHDHQRQGDEDVGDPAQQLINPSAAERGGDAQGDADGDLDDRRGQRDAQRHPGAVDETGEQVASGLRFDAEPVVAADAAQRADGHAPARGVDEGGVVGGRVLALDGGEQRRGERDQDEQRDDDRRDEGGTLRSQPPPELTGARGPRDGRGVRTGGLGGDDGLGGRLGDCLAHGATSPRPARDPGRRPSR